MAVGAAETEGADTRATRLLAGQPFARRGGDLQRRVIESQQRIDGFQV